MRVHSLWYLLLLALASLAPASTQSPKLIGGSGPIDRPTAHTVYWCFHEWSCATVDSFTADGATASVVFTARNWDSFLPSSPMQIRLDNVVVMTRDEYFANLTPVGSATNDIGCSFSSSDLMLDYVNLPPVNYITQFAGGIGPEWTFDATQVSYLSTGTYEDPFSPLAPITTGCMKMGAGSGPEFVTAELQLSGLTPGESYVVSYWWRSLDEAGGGNQNCAGPNDDFELKIYGEELVCVPDPPNLFVQNIQTINWQSPPDLWRFQAVVGNNGAGPAQNLWVTLEDVSAGIVVTGASAFHGNMAPSATELHAVGPLEVDMAAYGGGGSLYLLFLLEYEDDCGQPQSLYYEFNGTDNPLRYPSDALPSQRSLTLRQNVPNPFNPRTTIQFELSEAGLVRLDILDARGRLVRRLAQRSFEAGEHRLPWDGRDDEGREMAAGNYFYRLNANGQSSSRRMVLLK